MGWIMQYLKTVQLFVTFSIFKRYLQTNNDDKLAYYQSGHVGLVIIVKPLIVGKWDGIEIVWL